MNYRITLPADYDMGVIRQRVATRGRALDGFPGLGQKAYLVRERGRDGSPVNEYAPFYLWRTPEGMNSFLFGPGFRGLAEDFGRPVVEHWSGLGFERGPAVDEEPHAASRHARRLPPGADLPALVEDEIRHLAALATAPGLHSAALLLDPRRWELLRFTLWQDAAPEEPGAERFEVLHLSRPELAALPTGRQW
jgi:hypothetical protein